jgi:hypothetical protein
MSYLDQQEGGDHYKKYPIQPIEYNHANNIPYIEGECIAKLTRWRDKGGIGDLKKVIHSVQLLIELEEKREAWKAFKQETSDSRR